MRAALRSHSGSDESNPGRSTGDYNNLVRQFLELNVHRDLPGWNVEVATVQLHCHTQTEAIGPTFCVSEVFGESTLYFSNTAKWCVYQATALNGRTCLATCAPI